MVKTRRTLSHAALRAGFIGGFVAALTVLVWEVPIAQVLPLRALPPLVGAATHAVLIAAIPEEMVKFAATLFVVHRFADRDNAADVILTALAVALGFAVTEDAVYVTGAAAHSARAGGMIAVLRAVTAVPMHAMFGLVMGALAAGAIRSRGFGAGAGIGRLILAPLVPALMHGAYDFLLLLIARDPRAVWAIRLLPLVMSVSVALAIVLSTAVLRHSHRSDRAARAGAAAPAMLGVFLLAVGLLFVVVVMITPGIQLKQAMTALCVMPLLLGLDLIRAAMGRLRG
jgi:RsiW-degrading membrane proteinase PrsW (M82 family)